jgi:hypothetical protein
MKASSSLLDALVGGVFAFSDPSPRIASHEPAKVTPSVAIASCGRQLVDTGLRVLQGEPYVVRSNLPAEDIVHSHHLVEGQSQSVLQFGTYGCAG